MEEGCEEEVEKRMRDIQEQEWREKLEKSSYAEKIKLIIGKEENLYKKKWIKETKKGLETLARFRMGSENRSTKYWKEEIEKVCRVCGKERDDIEHVMENVR